MALRFKTSLPVLLFLLICLSSGIAEGLHDNVNPVYLHHKLKGMNPRKLLVVDTVLDYDYTGPNPKHYPRKGKPGSSGSKNP
ncbi:unnamed protein product [Camellia sinensis]